MACFTLCLTPFPGMIEIPRLQAKRKSVMPAKSLPPQKRGAGIQGGGEADVLMLVSFQQKLNYRLVVRPEIRTTVDLKGKVLGVTRFGTVNDSTMRLLLGKLGVNPEKDVTLIQIGDASPVVTASLVSGKTLDGALLQPPYYVKAVESGMRVLANMEEMDIPF